jgi:hypothetical protein
MLVASLAALAACTQTTASTEPPQATPTAIGSSVETVTWTDGKPAFSIACDAPGGCQQRALMMCRQGNYTVLRSHNMPTAGNQRETRGAAAVVIRCG